MMTLTIDRNGQQYGPYSRVEVQRYLSGGGLLPSDLAWKEAEQRWLPLGELYLLPPPVPRGTPTQLNPVVSPQKELAQSHATGASTRRMNKVALTCTIAVWLAWLFLPFLTVGWGPFQLADATVWDCLDLSSNGLLKFLGLLAISAPVLALMTRSGLGRCLYLAPIIYLGGATLLALTQLGELIHTVGASTKDSPLVGAIAEAGIGAAMRASSFDYGAYVLALASLVLGFQIFARR